MAASSARQNKDGSYNYIKVRDLETAVNSLINIYGVVRSFKLATTTATGLHLLSLKIVDQTTMNDGGADGLRCVLMSEKKKDIPPNIQVGNVVRFHRLRIVEFQGFPQGKIGPGFSWLVAEGETVKHSHSHYTYTAKDKERILHLQNWVKTSPLFSHTLTNSTPKITISDIQHDEKWFDLILQVISVHCSSTDASCIVIRAWDGTKPSFKSFLHCAMADETQPPDKELLESVAGHVINIHCYDDHLREAMQLLPGQFIRAVNIHAKVINSFSLDIADQQGFINRVDLEDGETWIGLVLHRGTAYGRRIDVLNEQDAECKDIKLRCESIISKAGSANRELRHSECSVQNKVTQNREVRDKASSVTVRQIHRSNEATQGNSNQNNVTENKETASLSRGGLKMVEATNGQRKTVEDEEVGGNTSDVLLKRNCKERVQDIYDKNESMQNRDASNAGVSLKRDYDEKMKNNQNKAKQNTEQEIKGSDVSVQQKIIDKEAIHSADDKNESMQNRKTGDQASNAGASLKRRYKERVEGTNDRNKATQNGEVGTDTSDASVSSKKRCEERVQCANDRNKATQEGEIRIDECETSSKANAVTCASNVIDCAIADKDSIHGSRLKGNGGDASCLFLDCQQIDDEFKSRDEINQRGFVIPEQELNEDDAKVSAQIEQLLQKRRRFRRIIAFHQTGDTTTIEFEKLPRKWEFSRRIIADHKTDTINGVGNVSGNEKKENVLKHYPPIEMRNTGRDFRKKCEQDSEDMETEEEEVDNVTERLRILSEYNEKLHNQTHHKSFEITSRRRIPMRSRLRPAYGNSIFPKYSEDTDRTASRNLKNYSLSDSNNDRSVNQSNECVTDVKITTADQINYIDIKPFKKDKMAVGTNFVNCETQNSMKGSGELNDESNVVNHESNVANSKKNGNNKRELNDREIGLPVGDKEIDQTNGTQSVTNVNITTANMIKCLEIRVERLYRNVDDH